MKQRHPTPMCLILSLIQTDAEYSTARRKRHEQSEEIRTERREEGKSQKKKEKESVVTIAQKWYHSHNWFQQDCIAKTHLCSS